MTKAETIAACYMLLGGVTLIASLFANDVPMYLIGAGFILIGYILSKFSEK